MRAPLALRVDPWRAAEAGECLRGLLAPERTPRLAAHAAPGEPLEVSVSFARGDGPGVEVSLEVRGRYHFTCQRCLAALELARDDRARVLVVADEETARAMESGDEVVVSAPGSAMDLAALVEDEVLLALPFAPRHPPGECEMQCSAPASPPEGAAGEPAEPERENPFAVLETLRRGRREDSH